MWVDGITMQTFSCDIETDGIEATKVWCIAVQDVYTEETKVWYPEQGWDINENGSFQDWLDSGEVDSIVFHNGIAFDVPVLEELHSICFNNVTVEDTLIMSQLDSPRREGGHSLANWGEYLGYHKGDHEDWSKLSTEMVEYCIRDTEITSKVYKILRQKGLSQDAKELEYAIKRQCTIQEKNGWLFDERGAIKILQQVNDDLRNAEEEVHKTFKPLPLWKSKTPVKNRFKKDFTRTKGYQAEVELQCHTNEEGDYGYWHYPELNLGSRNR